MLLGGVHNGQLAQHLAVALKADDVRVMVRDAHAGRVTAAAAAQVDVELAGRMAARDGNIHPLQVSVQLRKLLLRHGGDDLQVTRRVARNEADGNGGADALAPAGVWDDDAFDVFQNVAADGGVHPLGQCAQQLPKGRGAVGNGDRLRAAGRRDELLAQDIKIILQDRLFQHVASSLYRYFGNACAMFTKLMISYFAEKGKKEKPVRRRAWCCTGDTHRLPKKTYKPITSAAALRERHGRLQITGQFVDRTRLVGERHAAPGAAPAQSTSCR